MPEHDSLHKLDPASLKPYHGYQSSFLPLDSGHYLYLASWDSTPTPYEKFSNLWLITPEDKRILFADPAGSSAVVTLYHEFQEILGASIGMKWTGADQIRIQCESDGSYYQLSATLLVKETRKSRLLLKLGAGPPSRFRMSKPVIRISNFLLDSLVARGGACLLGRTETGQPFYHGETEHLYLVTGGAVTLNGRDLGSFSVPTWPVEFGDAVPFTQPVLKIGTLYIPFGGPDED
ncbi:MAG: hypothetical protein ACK2TT_06945 [Anaerolineales bacterium]